MPVYVAFPVSETLCRNIHAFSEAVADRPEVIHQQLIDRICQDFIHEVLDAFFDGPVKTLNLQGSMAGVMNGVISIIGKASRALVGKVFHKVSVQEQQILARQLAAIRITVDSRHLCGFPLDDEAANEASLMFESFRKGGGDEAHLVKVMGMFTDGAIEHFFDRTISTVKTGAITRALVSAGRATIHKAAHSSMQKSLPGLHPKLRQPVLNYFENMLVEVERT